MFLVAFFALGSRDPRVEFCVLRDRYEPKLQALLKEAELVVTLESLRRVAFEFQMGKSLKCGGDTNPHLSKQVHQRFAFYLYIFHLGSFGGLLNPGLDSRGIRVDSMRRPVEIMTRASQFILSWH